MCQSLIGSELNSSETVSTCQHHHPPDSSAQSVTLTSFVTIVPLFLTITPFLFYDLPNHLTNAMGSCPLAMLWLQASTHSGILQEGSSHRRPIPCCWDTLEGTELALWSFPPQWWEWWWSVNYAYVFPIHSCPYFPPVSCLWALCVFLFFYCFHWTPVGFLTLYCIFVVCTTHFGKIT